MVGNRLGIDVDDRLKKKTPREILELYPSRMLSTVAVEVDDVARFDVKRLRRKCLMLCQIHDGVAVAGPQIGLGFRLFYLRSLDEVVFNPHIFERSSNVSRLEEGCLSVPGKVFEVPRSETVTWGFEVKAGGRVEVVEDTVSGFDARIVQHEVDHLNGLCLPDLFGKLQAD